MIYGTEDRIRELKISTGIACGILSFIFMIGLSGCAEPFLGGFVAGATAMEQIAKQSQEDLHNSINTLHEKKAEIDSLINQIEDTEVKAAFELLIEEQTLEEIEKINKTDWKDPQTTIPSGIALFMTIAAAYQKIKRGKVN